MGRLERRRMTNRLEGYRLSPQMMMPWHPGVTVSTERAAAMLGVSATTILRMIQDGTLEGFKLRKNRKNSPYKVIRESILRVAEEWRRDAGVQSAPDAPRAARATGART